MSKKKKPSAKQVKPNTQESAPKPAKEAAASKKDASDAKKETSTKQSTAAASQPKDKKPEQAETNSEESKGAAKGKISAEANVPAATKAPADSKSVASKTESAESKGKDAEKASTATQKGGKKKKDKTPRQSVKSEEPADERVDETVMSPIVDARLEQSTQGQAAVPNAEVAEAPVQDTFESLNVREETPSAPVAPPRKVAKTLIDEEITLPPQDSPLHEADIASLKEAAAKATGIAPKAEEPPRKVAKTLMEIDQDSLRNAIEASARATESEIAAARLRDAVEASARAIEDEIAAAIAESQAPESPASVNSSDAQEPVSKPAVSKSADRKVAKTMLDFKAEEFFELADFGTDSASGADSVDSTAPAAPTTAALSEAKQTAPPPGQQPRKVAKTMLEVDVANINAMVEQASAAAQSQNAYAESAAQASQRIPAEAFADATHEPRDLSAGYDDVSMDDLNEFAQALRDNTAMSPPGSRTERLKKTFMGIRKRGLSSSPSMPGVSFTRENATPNVADSVAPVQVSRSLHPLDNFSFDDICPADDPASVASQNESMPPEQDVLADSISPAHSEPSEYAEWHESQDQGSAGKKNTGTVELSQNPHNTGASAFKGETTVWPDEQEKRDAAARQGAVKPERFIPKTMLDMEFLKESLSVSVSRAEERLAESIAQKQAAPPKQVLTADDYKMATPNCPFVWSENPDNPKERVKYCTNCNAQVYNLSGFDMNETQSLIFKRENRNNAPLYKREDGKFMTSDCPIALKKKKDKQMLIGGAALVLVLLIIMVVASFMAPQPPQAPASTTTDSSTSSDTATSSTTGESTNDVSGSSKTGALDTPGTFHYKRGKVTKEPDSSAPAVTVPQDSQPAVPGTNSGYDEGGQFWQYSDKGNN